MVIQTLHRVEVRWSRKHEIYLYHLFMISVLQDQDRLPPPTPDPQLSCLVRVVRKINDNRNVFW